MGGLVYVLTLITVLAVVGRLSVPPRERLALRRWTLRDVGANALRGLVVLCDHGPALPVDRRREQDAHRQPR